VVQTKKITSGVVGGFFLREALDKRVKGKLRSCGSKCRRGERGKNGAATKMGGTR